MSLPDRWATAKLADLIASDGEFADGDWVESKDQDPKGLIRLLQLADVGDGEFLDKSHRFVNQEQFERLRCTEVLPGDVLIARMPDPLGRACVAAPTSQRRITVVDVAIARPGTSSVDPKWLMYSLNSPDVRRAIEVQASGTTRRRISRAKLAGLMLAVPPVPEQLRISNKLQTLMARVKSCQQRLSRLPVILKRLRETVLEAAVSGKLTEEWRESRACDGVRQPYERRLLADLISEPLRNGKSVRDGNGLPVLRLTSIRGNFIDLSESKKGEWTGIDSERFLVAAGDFLVSRGNGSKHLVARGALVPENPIPIAFPDTMIRIRPNQNRMLPRFLQFIWDSLTTRTQIESIARTTAGIWKVSQPDLEGVTLPVPDLKEQGEIVRRVDELFSLVDSLTRRYSTASALAKKLTPSILLKAFRGELVPQDPTDEPASALLERIRQRWEDAEAGAKYAKRKSPQPSRRALVTTDRSKSVPREAPTVVARSSQRPNARKQRV